ncbi:MAG: 50S ribosomal protein L1 [Fimbriimonadales bacterium]|nr:MAG: 50S ribosomal protein L1 [Armatimonadota bacterium]MBV6503786.1 50S ribosomal protein L1 [Fimbriimonadales bacterium]MCE7899679.1 50S ribosomal protein L1 [Armatimonadetes bacterium ATM1]MDL1927764.1 50S ribosomal protein L1 [Fimbriimonadia bacterium ATM]MBC6970458.1 50S ribosomal protein L1 [Armatimonadota bacterium]
MRQNVRKQARSARYQAVRQGTDRLTLHSPDEAVALVKKSATAKFAETVDLAVRLGIDSKKGDQNVRGTCNLPHGTGKSRKVAVLAKGDQAAAAEAAGADEVGGDELVEKIAGGFKAFDVLIAAQEMAPVLAKIGRVLGPKTPNKKSGTLTDDVASAVREIKQATRVEYRNDKAGIIHMPIGKVSFSEDQLKENLNAALSALLKAKPSSAKGKYLVTVTLSSTMGPSFRIDPSVASKAAL